MHNRRCSIHLLLACSMSWPFPILRILFISVWLIMFPSTVLADEKPSIDADQEPLIPDDIVSSIPVDLEQPFSIETTDYKVTPIYFVPNDVTPHATALQYINNQMGLIQRWYPPSSETNWGYCLWGTVFADLNTLGYSSQPNRIRAVFFHNEGIGGVALGSGDPDPRFLFGLNPLDIFSDCRRPGCGYQVNTGGTAHELGHALNLPHTEDDLNGSPLKSLMGVGFYQYPRVTLVNTTNNPERDTLLASPFLNTTLLLKNSGFEDCAADWSLEHGGYSCTSSSHSGLSALVLQHAEQNRISQTVDVEAGQTYDLSGWFHSLSRSKFGVFGYFQSRLQGFWSHLFRFRLQKTTYFISENRPNLTQKLDIDRQICIYVNCLARILSQNLKFGSTESATPDKQQRTDRSHCSLQQRHSAGLLSSGESD
ncbi:hypothetical protein KFU94_02175 [Chloroflexi bacterium TSY]|nr:hypothetical protein [Chloroflexi bacterium TSY]